MKNHQVLNSGKNTRIENWYNHCNDNWFLEDCDSFHNDRCPECDKEIQPYESFEYKI